MRRVGTVLACAALLGAFGIASPRGGAIDLNGFFTGKKAYLDIDLVSNETNRGSCPLELSVTHVGSAITVQFNILCPDDPVKSFTLTGETNGEYFWAQGSTDFAEGVGYTILVSGKVGGGGSSLKGTGTFLYGPYFISQVKFNAKRGNPK